MVVAAVAWVEDLYPDLAVLVEVFGGDGVTNLLQYIGYPEAPVPKSMATTCVKMSSYLSKAIIYIMGIYLNYNVSIDSANAKIITQI